MAEAFRAVHIVSIVIHLLGISLLSYLLARRAPSGWRNLGTWKNLTWGKLCLFLVLLDIWLFLFVSSVLLHGVRPNWDPVTCEAVIDTCVFFEGSGKVLTACFLVERMHIVRSKGHPTPRFKSRAYHIGIFLILGFIAIDVLFFLGRKSSIREDGECVLAYKLWSTVTLLVYEGLQDLFFTAMFAWPLRRTSVISPRLRIVARRSCYGAVGSLVISFVSSMVVVHMSNSGVGWICMDACMIEATLNASILYWVSSGAPSDSVKHVSMPEIPVTVKTNSRVTVTAAITSTLQFMGQTDSHHTASIASQADGRDPEKGLPPSVVQVGNSNYQPPPPVQGILQNDTQKVGIRPRRSSF